MKPPQYFVEACCFAPIIRTSLRHLILETKEDKEEIQSVGNSIIEVIWLCYINCWSEALQKMTQLATKGFPSFFP